MTKRILTALMVLGCAFLPALAQRGTTSVEFDGKKVLIEYGRPAVGGQDRLAQAPVGTIWRMGMNTATTLQTEATLHFGDQVVEPGDYRLWAKRTGKESWDLLINSDTGGHDPANDVAVVPLAYETLGSSVEDLTIELTANGNQGTFTLTWSTMKISVGFTAE